MGKAKKRAEKKIKQMKADIRADIAATPTYQLPGETQQLLDLYAAQAGKLEGVAQYGQEALGLAEQQASMVEAPGFGIAQQQIQAGAAGNVQNIMEAGGAGSLGAIAQAGQTELSAMGDLALQNQQFRQQASADYQQALTGQAGLESSLIGQGTAMQAAGLQSVIQQRQYQYETEIDKARALQQFDLNKLQEETMADVERKNKRAQIIGGVIEGASKVASSYAGGIGGSGGTTT